MNFFFLKVIGKLSATVVFIAFFNTALANDHRATLTKVTMPGNTFAVADTAKHSAKKNVKDIDEDKAIDKDKGGNKNQPEDGVDDDIRARNKQEFDRTKDPALNRIPVERLLQARRVRDQMLARPVGNVKTGGVTPGNSISTVQWTERGPNNVGGRTRALMFDLNDAANGYKKVFAGGVGGGLWVTNDITATPVSWAKINDFFASIAISCITQNPVNPREIYVGTGEGMDLNLIPGLGVWKSSDDGATWTQLASTTGFTALNSILVDKNSNVYLAVEGNGIQKSADGGTTWTQVAGGALGPPQLGYLPLDGVDLQLAANGDIYASTGVIYTTGNVYISDFAINGTKTGNAGTWTNITPETTGVITPSTSSWWRIKLAAAPGDANTVYGLFEGNGSLNLSSLQRYNKATNTWAVENVPGEAFNNGQAWYSIAAAVDPNNSNVLYAGSLDAEKSTDGGQTWTQLTYWGTDPSASNYVHADHHAYVYPPGSSTRLLMGTDGGVFYTVNANATPSFLNKNNGYNVTQFYAVAIHPTKTNYFLAGAQDNGTQQYTTAGLNNTNVATGGDGGDVFIDQTNGNIQITSYTYNNHWISVNGGADGFLTTEFFSNTGSFINPSDYDPATKNLYSGNNAGQYFLWSNVINTSAPVTSGVTVSGFNNANITAVTVSPLTANRVYFGLDNGTVVRVDNANTGTSNTGVVLSPGVKGGSVSCIAIDPASEAHLLVTYTNYGVQTIFETKNATAATPVWTSVVGNLPDMPVRSTLFYPGDVTKAIIATELGVWTTDALSGSSTTWTPANSGLANVQVDMLKFRASDRTLAAATFGRGMFTTVLPVPPLVDATLSNFTISNGTLSPVFASGTTSYTDAIANFTTSITVLPTANNSAAMISVNGKPLASGVRSAEIPMNLGANTITIVVTAQDGVTKNTYTIAVTRLLSPNALLASISLSPAATLVGTTGTGYLNFKATVATTTTSIKVIPTAKDATAKIIVNGTAVTSGSASASIPLTVGANTITTIITAADGTTKKTVITVTRLPSSSALLASISLSPVATLVGTTGTGYLNFTAAVGTATTSIQVIPTAKDATAKITVNGSAVTSGSASASIPLTVGANKITTLITAGDGTTTKTIIITVNRAPSTDALLTAIKLTPAATLATVAGPGSVNYTTSVPYTTSSVTVTPTEQDATAAIMVNGVATTSGTASASIPLKVGGNVITTVVTAQDGKTTKSYIITATRTAATDALLTAIKLTPASTLKIVSGPGYVNYTTSVPNTTASVTVTATKQDANAAITVNGATTSSGTASASIPLTVGDNTITTAVTAQDGITVKNYIITATRAAPGGANSLDGTLSVTNPADNVAIENDGITVHPGISPNGDGINDFLKIDGIANYPDNSLTIVDRNGLLVYETKGYGGNSKFFDGHSSINGKMQLPGTYFYSLDYTVNGQNKHQTGYIILKY